VLKPAPERFNMVGVAILVAAPLQVAKFQFRDNSRMNDDILGTVIQGC
jgi:hypothetical protein